jgi:hypothetical protein
MHGLGTIRPMVNRAVKATMKKIGFILCVYCMVTGCSGLVGKGDRLYESGLYHESAELYEQALKRDPSNVEAKTGLRRARYKMIDRGLIQVRMMRLSENWPGAAHKLEQILRNELDWTIEVPAVVTFTQAEETRYAKSWLLKEAELLSLSEHPDKFRWFQFSYAQLIATTQIEGRLEQYNVHVTTKGKDKCKDLAGTIDEQQFFFANVTRKYCAAWGGAIRLRSATADNTRYSGITLVEKIQYLSPYIYKQQNSVQNHLDRLSEGFEQSIWFSSNSPQKLAVDVTGDVDYNRRIKEARRSVSYETKKFEKKEPDDNTPRKLIVKKKKYRYRVQVHHETFSVNITYAGRIDNQRVSKTVYREKKHSSQSHEEYLPAADLYPQKPTTMNISEVFNGYLQKLNNEFLAELNQQWEARYCHEQVAQSPGENVFRCGELQPDNIYVNNWVKQKFGIDYRQLVELYGV